MSGMSALNSMQIELTSGSVVVVRPVVDNEIVSVAKVRGELQDLRGDRHDRA